MPLIEKLSMILQNHVDEMKKRDSSYPQIEVLQCKEKFGSLRFYTNHCDEFVRGSIEMAESMSLSICENCSFPGTLRKDDWWRVRCDSCEEKRRKEIQERESAKEVEKNERS